MDQPSRSANGSPVSCGGAGDGGGCDQSSGSTSSQTNPNNHLAIFCREVRNLLRSKPNCMIPFSKFVPAYHNHYGRQCCVYQFGYTKLIELLEAIPHVVQILGDGSSATNRYITLTHREQIKRFASDLIKVVKSQPGKRLRLSQFAQAYEQVLGRIFRVEDYGTNNINVLLAEIWEGTINIIPINRDSLNNSRGGGPGSSSSRNSSISGGSSLGADEAPERTASERASSQYSADRRRKRCRRASGTPRPLFVDVPLPRNNPILEQLVAANQLVNKPYITDQHPDCWFEIPRRERSDKEIKRTKYFIWDCIELLSKMKQNQYAVPFSKFIPAYHYYFNRQCKVSIFGFSKLIDLFESISPSVVDIIDQGPGEEKLIKLARKYWPKQTPNRRPLNNNNNNNSSVRSRAPFNGARRSGEGGHYVIMSSSSFTKRRSPSSTTNNVAQHQQQQQQRSAPPTRPLADGHQSRRQSDRESLSPGQTSASESAIESDGNNENDDDEVQGEHICAPTCEMVDEQQQQQQELQVTDVDRGRQQPEPIDSGPTEEELLELEDELKAYEELQAIQRKRSGRMAAILDIFKYSIYY